jgi:hypothetical protein
MLSVDNQEVLVLHVFCCASTKMQELEVRFARAIFHVSRKVELRTFKLTRSLSLAHNFQTAQAIRL